MERSHCRSLRKQPFPHFRRKRRVRRPAPRVVQCPRHRLSLFGDSTCGKTTALAAGASVWGPPLFVLSWRSTANGLESQAAIRSSTMIALDESHMAEPKTLDNGIYLLANGVAKSRMTKEIAARDLARWWASIFSSASARSSRTWAQRKSTTKPVRESGSLIFRSAETSASSMISTSAKTAACSPTRYGTQPPNITVTLARSSFNG